MLLDWFNLLNRGHRYAAVGNSDSHSVYGNYAGYPRNFVRSSTDDPGAIQPTDVAAVLRKRQVFTTLGPFVDFSVNGTSMGGDATASGVSASRTTTSGGSARPTFPPAST